MRTSSNAWRPPATAVKAASMARGSSAGSSTRRAQASEASATFVNSGEGWQAVESATRVVYPDGAAAHAAEMPLVELRHADYPRLGKRE